MLAMLPGSTSVGHSRTGGSKISQGEPWLSETSRSSSTISATLMLRTSCLLMLMAWEMGCLLETSPARTWSKSSETDARGSEEGWTYQLKTTWRKQDLLPKTRTENENKPKRMVRWLIYRCFMAYQSQSRMCSIRKETYRQLVVPSCARIVIDVLKMAS